MAKLTLSDKYGMAAAIGLLIMAAIDNAVVMLVVSLLGIATGLFVARRGEVRRIGILAFAAFVVAAAFAAYLLIRTG